VPGSWDEPIRRLREDLQTVADPTVCPAVNETVKPAKLGSIRLNAKSDARGTLSKQRE